MISIDLHGKTALVTGATGQLGRTIARTLAQAGAGLVLCYHQNKAMADQLCAEIQRLEVPVMAVQADVTDLASILAMRDTIAKQLGAPHILVNNAVIQYKWTSVLEQDPADYESQFRSCVLHNLYMAKAFVPAMIERNAGRIIAINTECAMQCFPSQSDYVSGKRGMDGLLRVLAKEIGPHQITVNQIAPGWMISDRDRAAHSEQQEGYSKAVPLRRRGTDQDIANAVAFLASDLANFISGAYLSVSGGGVMPTI